MSFSIDLAKRVKWLGLLFVFNEIVQVIIVFFLSRNYESISINSYLNNESLKKGIDLAINPRLEFDVTIFIVGLSLLVLCMLLTKGNTIEQENELTI